MSVKVFTDEDVLILKESPYVKRVSNKGITYTDEFKRLYMLEKLKGKTSVIIFREFGFDMKALGRDRSVSAGIRWTKAYNKYGEAGLIDRRKGNSGRPRKDGANVKGKNKKETSNTETEKKESTSDK